MADASSYIINAAVEAALRKRDAELKNSQKQKGSNPLLDNYYTSNISSCKKQKTAIPPQANPKRSQAQDQREGQET